MEYLPKRFILAIDIDYDKVVSLTTSSTIQRSVSRSTFGTIVSASAGHAEGKLSASLTAACILGVCSSPRRLLERKSKYLTQPNPPNHPFPKTQENEAHFGAEAQGKNNRASMMNIQVSIFLTDGASKCLSKCVCDARAHPPRRLPIAYIPNH